MAHRILVVEDHEATRRALTGTFTRMGWIVTSASSVSEGLAALENEPEPCCMILDIDLPDGTGDQILRAARRRNFKSRVVVSSGTLDSVRLKAITDLEPDALMSKPISVESVWNDVCRVCVCGES